MPARRVHFNRLPEPVRRRFVEAVAGAGEPAPILRFSSSGRWWAGPLAFILAILTVGAWAVGLGDPYTGLSAHGAWGVPVFALLIGGTLTCTLIAIADKRGRKVLPFEPGRYLFGTDLVDAYGPVLVIRPLAELTRVQTRGTFLMLSWDGHAVPLPTTGGDSMRALREKLEQAAQRRASELTPERAAEFDVFHGFRDTAGWQRPLPHPPQRPGHGVVVTGAFPGWLARPLGVSMLVGVLFAFPVHLARDSASDEGRFEAATAVGSFEALERYLEVGGGYEDEVRERHMPKAALEVARRQRTVKALREFITGEWADEHTRKIARRHISRRFARARERFLAEASDNRDAVAVVESLLSWLEAHDSPPVEVRFRAPGVAVLESIDQVIAKAATSSEAAGVAEVSPWFTPDASEVREESIAEALAGGFRRVFPGDILTIEHGPRLRDDEDVVGAGLPIIEVMYVISPKQEAGDIVFYARDASSRSFVGISMAFEVMMHVPGREPFAFDFVVAPPERFEVSRAVLDAADADSRSSEGIVYDVMARRAFEELRGRLVEAFFRAPSRQAGRPAGER